MTESHAVTIDDRKEGAATGATQEHGWLFVDGASTFGGHEVMLLRWIEELAAQRTTRCSLLARRGSPLAQAGARHASVLDLPTRRGVLGRWVGVFGDAIAMIRAVLATKPRLCVVAEGCLLDQPLFVVLARLMGCRLVVYVPMVQTSVSMGFGSGRLRDALVRRIYAHMPHGWVTLTRDQAKQFRAWARVRRPIFVLPNTVSVAIEQHGPRDLHEPTVQHQNPRLRILVLGRIEAHQKGLDTLLNFLTAHPELGKGMSVSFVGSGPYEDEVRARLSTDAALASWVSLHPWSTPIDALTAHDVLLMTSRYEGVPLVMLEAMALGIPVIAPDLDGTRGFLHGSDVFPPGQIDAAFARLKRMSDPMTRRTVAQRNRATFEASASNAAFSSTVKALTRDMEQLRSASLARSA